jgi:hypothetical protein
MRNFVIGRMLYDIELVRAERVKQNRAQLEACGLAGAVEDFKDSFSRNIKPKAKRSKRTLPQETSRRSERLKAINSTSQQQPHIVQPQPLPEMPPVLEDPVDLQAAMVAALQRFSNLWAGGQVMVAAEKLIKGGMRPENLRRPFTMEELKMIEEYIKEPFLPFEKIILTS